MKAQIGSILIAIGLIALTSSSANAQTDSTLAYQITGSVVDLSTSDPVPSASIFIAGSSVGTVTNKEGDFVLKVPRAYMNDSLVISCMGYESHTIAFNQLNKEKNLVHLRAIPIPLEEVTIINQDARHLISEAIQKIGDNYSNQAMMVTSFYRESIRKGRKYAGVSEAVLEGYKASYTSIFDKDRVTILKARKSTDFKNRDTVLLKLQGGPLTMFNLDFVKDPGELIDVNIMPYYEYHLSGQTSFGNKQAHVISFHQLPEIDVPLYKGYFFVGVEDKAFMGAEFHLHEDHMDRAAEFMVKEQPPGAKLEVNNAEYEINYRYFNGKWHFSYILTEIVVTVNWDKKLFNSSYTIRAEMAVTDVDNKNVVRFDKADIIREKDVFVEQIADFEDPEYWGDYNIIRPEEPIQSAIERMGKNSSLSSPPGSDSNR